jgi:sugar phosphate isomerase/epimerase
MELAFSTAWAGGEIDRVHSILPHIDSLEIGSRGDSRFFHELEALIRGEDVPVTSIHAVAYPGREGEDAYYAPRLASLDSRIRLREIDELSRTAEWALGIGARALVVHTGRVEDAPLRDACRVYRNEIASGTGRESLAELFEWIVQRRGSRSGPYLDSIVGGLDRLCPRFPELSFFIETRVNYYEIPLPDELGAIFGSLSCSNLGYWHDIGHTQMLDVQGFVPGETWQMRFSDRCGGAHVHDMDDAFLDHYPPGEGVLDIPRILEQFDSRVILTLEINARNDFDSVLRGIRYLRTDRIAQIGLHS